MEMNRECINIVREIVKLSIADDGESLLLRQLPRRRANNLQSVEYRCVGSGARADINACVRITIG